MFRPIASQVILAKVKSSDESSIRLSVGFFDDMYVPSAYLPMPNAFDPVERAHFWVAPTNDDRELPSQHLLDTPISERMYIDTGEVVRVRVEADEFYDDEPGPPNASKTMSASKSRRRPPFVVTCSIAEQGLGPVAWWKAPEEAEPE